VKITDVSLTMFTWKIPTQAAVHRFSAAAGSKEIAVVTISTDEGIEGRTFLGASNRGADIDVPAVLTYLKPTLMGQNPFDIGRLWNDMSRWHRVASLRAIGAMDVALWDLMGNALKQPIHRLLGTCRTSAPAYLSSEHLPTVQAYVDEALDYKSRGVTAFKIHPHTIPEMDIKICQAVRKAVGDDYRLMLDSMWSYSYENAIRVGCAIEELDYYWYEDPLVDDDLYNYVKLRQKLHIPILATEYAPGGLYGLPQWILQGGTDMLRGDVTVKGGITSLIKICHLAEAFRMKCEIHHGGNSLMNVANLHVIMAVNNCEYFEVYLPDIAQKYGLVKDIEVDNKGLVHAPEKPGLGYEIDWELVKKNTTQVLK
jgi:L-alanine-DL-glutamate epimerase-like enolase superfamily enzyme